MLACERESRRVLDALRFAMFGTKRIYTHVLVTSAEFGADVFSQIFGHGIWQVIGSVVEIWDPVEDLNRKRLSGDSNQA